MTANGGSAANGNGTGGSNGNGKRNGARRVMLDMKVTQLTVDPMTNLPIVILKDVASETEAVPIWIGVAEASAIASELEQIALARPMPHDLIKNIIGEVGVTVERIEVHDFRDDIFYASIYLRAPDNREIRVDSRPSDALALALRCGARICVARKVIDEARRLDKRTRSDDPGASDGGDGDGLEGSPGILEALDDKDFGKWKM
jgi:bifunctional DNase/RNase